MTLSQIQAALKTPENEAQVRAITRTPFIAWPTVAMMIVCLSVFFSTVVLAVMGSMPLWVGALINGLIGYLIFSVIHDSIHRSVSSNQRLNDALGQFSLLAFSPMVSLGLFRWGHIQHHVHASSKNDPDRWCFEGPKWLLPVRWMFIDAWYFSFVLRSRNATAYKHLKPTLVMMAVTLTAFGVLTYLGYGWEVLFLWFIPTRITSLTLGFAFFWLPHEPHDTPQSENFTRATTIRKGWEWLLSPVLQYQNFHLIHHLFPRTPFFRNGEMWALLEPELRKYDLAIQHDFAIKPEIYPGSQSA